MSAASWIPFRSARPPEEAHHQVCDDRKLDPLPLQLELVRHEAGELEEILDEVLKALRVADDEVGESLGRRGVGVLEGRVRTSVSAAPSLSAR